MTTSFTEVREVRAYPVDRMTDGYSLYLPKKSSVLDLRWIDNKPVQFVLFHQTEKDEVYVPFYFSNKYDLRKIRSAMLLTDFDNPDHFHSRVEETDHPYPVHIRAKLIAFPYIGSVVTIATDKQTHGGKMVVKDGELYLEIGDEPGKDKLITIFMVDTGTQVPKHEYYVGTAYIPGQLLKHCFLKEEIL